MKARPSIFDENDTWGKDVPISVADYDDFADTYDSLFSDSFEDGPYWTSLELGEHVAELGCGSGRITRLLADQRSVTGIDPSARMLYRARRNLADLKSCSFREGGLLDIPASDGEFSSIVCPRGAFSHLISLADHLLAAEELRRCVASSGTVVVDVPFYHDAELQNLWAKERLVTTKRVGDERIKVFTMSTYNSLFRHIDMRERILVRQSGRASIETLVSLRTKVFSPSELVLALTSSGLRLESLHGNYDHTSVGSSSPRIIATLRK